MPAIADTKNLAVVNQATIGLALDFWKKKVPAKVKGKLTPFGQPVDNPNADLLPDPEAPKKHGGKGLQDEQNPIPPEWEDLMTEDEFADFESIPPDQWDELGLDDFDLTDQDTLDTILAVIHDDLPETVLDELRQRNESFFGGLINIGEWLAESAGLLALGAILGGILGAGGLSNFGSSVQQKVSDGIGNQLDFLNGFANDLEGGDVSAAQADARSDMYAGAAGNIIANLAAREAAVAAGMLWERRILDESVQNHCDCCLAAAADDWQPIGTLPDIGECECLTRCRCYFEHSDAEDPTADEGDGSDVGFGVKEDLEAAAAETNTSPTPAQASAGNYKKGKVNLHGLTISLENPKGSTRTKVGGDGKPWSRVMQSHYGYINRTTASDGDAVDVFIGTDPESEQVFVIDQTDADGRFDEVKVMLGFYNLADAKAGYLANYPSGWKCGPITQMTVQQFKDWLQSGYTGKPVAMSVGFGGAGSGDYGHAGRAGEVGGSSSEGGLSEKAQRAKDAHHMVDKEIQRYAEEHNEPKFAVAIGGKRLDDNEPVDVVMPATGAKIKNGIELKTMVDNKANKITMKRSAMELKAAWERENKADVHTVVIDDQKVFNANGKGQHDESQRQYYYKRGYGSFRVGSMQKVGSIAELQTLITTKDKDLPPAAQRPAGQSRGKLKS